ncbi:hypothetical protein ANN_16452 [Periplaneta americana]|uniref:Uncharacterized protein n=1 Tax=Periplaneta americana TaxID=6978 RepID=A0ABQ8SK85_PERAM|nr:hypothetical protein ANN_16452 [Periplaneta americana]
MSPGSSTESYPAFARIGLRENPGKPQPEPYSQTPLTYVPLFRVRSKFHSHIEEPLKTALSNAPCNQHYVIRQEPCNEHDGTRTENRSLRISQMGKLSLRFQESTDRTSQSFPKPQCVKYSIAVDSNFKFAFRIIRLSKNCQKICCLTILLHLDSLKTGNGETENRSRLVGHGVWTYRMRLKRYRLSQLARLYIIVYAIKKEIFRQQTG